MFEKVDSHRSHRAALLQPAGVWASAATHLALAAGIAAIPPRAAPVAELVEAVTFLALPEAPHLPAIAPRAPVTPPPAAPGPKKVVHTASAVPGYGPRHAEGNPLPRAPLPDLTPAATARSLPEVLRGPALSLAAGIGGGSAAIAPSAFSRSEAEESGIGPVVDAEVLAERPSLLNEREVVRLLGELYPERMKDLGIQGPAQVNFIIGTDGRVEEGSVQLIRLPHPEFRVPTLRGIARMRFRPARVGGVPVRVRAAIPVAWTLRESA